MATKTKKPKKKTQSSPLTAHEKWLVEQLPGAPRYSKTLFPLRVRRQIRAYGLEGKSRADVHKMRLSAWKVFRGLPENKGLPSWLVAARAVATGQWKLAKPPVAAGIAICYDAATRAELGRMAVESVDWGRLRKYGAGVATASAPRTQEWTNGKSGWKSVIKRRRDYLFVVSPDGRQVAVQVRESDPVKICSALNGYFLFEGRRLRCPLGYPVTKEVIPVRAWARYYRERGLPARVVRQTNDQVTAGSGEHNPVGEHLCIVIPVADTGTYYHPMLQTRWCENATAVKSSMETLIRRLITRELSGRSKSLLYRYADRIFVSFEDSLAAGNCSPGTERFANMVKAYLKTEWPVGAITASLVLRLLPDNDRGIMACESAVARYLQQQVPWAVQAAADLL
jgi:hypothetical protein